MKTDKKKNQILFFVSDLEKEIIKKKMKLIGMTNTSAYLRTIYGYLIEIDMSGLNIISNELQHIGNNINQLAKKANQTGNIYYDDIMKLNKELNEIKSNFREYTKFLNDGLKEHNNLV